MHVRRHEAELRLGAAENNLKRADELRRQQEKQLANLQKQAEEATKYKLISDQIKKIEVEGEAGGNLVKVVLSGDYELKSITISDAAKKRAKK